MKISATKTVSKFKCLQADCPDTCCKGWSMQLNDSVFAKYKGTELENAVDYDGQHKEIRVMKRDPETDYCVKFQGGICAIHKEKGPEMLGDACNFYPRVSRQFGDETIMTATLSCPEIARLALSNEGGAEFVESEVERLPEELKNYNSDLKIYQAFVDACNANDPADKILARIYSACQSLDLIDKTDWVGAAPFMLKMADGKIATPEKNPVNDIFILQLFAGVFHATRKKINPRLQEIISRLEKYLNVTIDWETLNLSGTGANKLAIISPANDEVLKKYILAQLSFSTFPLAGLGHRFQEKARFLIFKFCLVRLALRACPDLSAVDVIQPLSRVVDHLGDPRLTLNLMKELGWESDAKLMGLLLS